MSDPRDDLAALICASARSDLEAADLPWWPALDTWAKYAAHAIIAAGYVKPKPPTVYPDHDIDVGRAPYCTVCGRDIQWDDDTESWTH